MSDASSPGGNPLDLTPHNPLDLTPDGATEAEPAKKRRRRESPSPVDFDVPEPGDVEPLSPFTLPAGLRPVVQGCRGVEAYKQLNKIDEGAYGVVWRAEDKDTKQIVALKQLKLEKFPDGFPKSSLREITILLAIRHENCVRVKEMVVGSSMNAIFMVMEYMEHELKTLLWDMAEGTRARFSIAEVKSLLYQLLDGVDYLHSNYILHRDLKTSNILFNNQGVLKICDFGLARYFGDPLPTKNSHRVAPFTTLVVTLWYRSPELLLADPNRGVISYGPAVDCWSVGCIFGEMLVCKPIFFGEKQEIEHLANVFSVTGAPTEETWPGVKDMPLWQKLSACPQFKPTRRPNWDRFERFSHLTRQGMEVLSGLLKCNPVERLSCGDAMKHGWFSEAPARLPQHALPKWADSNSSTHDARRRIKSDDAFQPGAVGTGMGVCVNAKKYLADLEENAKGTAKPDENQNEESSKVQGPLPSGWLERKSSSTGKVYFINVKTKQTQWDRPTKPAS